MHRPGPQHLGSTLGLTGLFSKALSQNKTEECVMTEWTVHNNDSYQGGHPRKGAWHSTSGEAAILFLLETCELRCSLGGEHCVGHVLEQGGRWFKHSLSSYQVISRALPGAQE